MIPRIIHYGFFGDWGWTNLNVMCHQSWRRFMPDCKFVFWNPDTAPESKFIRRAMETDPANASSYMRFVALQKYGGIWIDNDVELIKPIDLRSFEFFAGSQRNDDDASSVNMAIIGSSAGHPISAQAINEMDKHDPGSNPMTFGPMLITSLLKAIGLVGINVEQELPGGVVVYDKERFYPWWVAAPHDKRNVTERTFGIHHWEGSWMERDIHDPSIVMSKPEWRKAGHADHIR
jgi:mannosyltransferase OCH1-like enzyme